MDRRSRAIVGMVILFIVLALAYSIIVPVFNAPDEPFHFEYIRFLATHKRLPNQTVEESSISSEGFNPPLYYLVGAVFLGLLSKDKAADIRIHTEQDLIQFYRNPGAGFSDRIYPPLNPAYIKWGRGKQRNMFISHDRFPFSGSIRVIHILRLISILFGALTILFVFKIAQTLFPSQRNIALLAAALCAFNPQFTFLSGVLNNDNLVTMFSAIALWLLARLILSEGEAQRWLVGLGAVIGLGLISKVNISFLVAISVPGIIYQVLMTGKERRLRRIARNLGLFLAPLLAVCGWYFLRNIFIYGLDDPLGWKLQAIQNPSLVMPSRLRAQFLKYAFAPSLFTSFWGKFDWLTIKLSGWAYWIYGLISLMGLVGGYLAIRLSKKNKENQEAKRVNICLLLYLAAISLAVINLIILNYTFLSAQGRLIFPVMAALCIFMAMGLDRGLAYLARLFRVHTEWLVYSFILFLIGLNVYTLVWVIYPVYH